MNKREFKDRIYTELTRITKSMSNPHRLEIIELLAQGEFSVEQISEQISLSVANTSQHLQVLKDSRLADITRKGNFIFYRLANRNIFKVWRALRELGIERNAGIENAVHEFRKSKFDFEILTIDQLAEKLNSGKVTVLDVRPKAEFKQGHIAGALSVPVAELSKRLKELPKHLEIVAYCRGPFCVYADEAVALLTKAGYRAKRLDEGFPDWKLLNLPVEVSIN